MSDRNQLWELCQRFIREQRITCDEAVYQQDNVIANACEFIEGVCEIVGYHDEDKPQ
ncbi:MAG: hypothetical protein KG075_21910 [Alphaproteobacteria bacterium]|nr:hypothetical protein [Alphaproteobacteria bacterium]MBS4049016.1 hypothetical protein [Alphaproteobacteria bacterium]